MTIELEDHLVLIWLLASELLNTELGHLGIPVVVDDCACVRKPGSILLGNVVQWQVLTQSLDGIIAQNQQGFLKPYHLAQVAKFSVGFHDRYSPMVLHHV